MCIRDSVTADVKAALDIIEDLKQVNTLNGKDSKSEKISIDAKSTIREGETAPKLSPSEEARMQKILNNAIRALNMSATSVFELAGSGETYRECITVISDNSKDIEEFEELFGVGPAIVESMLDRDMLNEPILDVIVQNSKRVVDNPFE